MRPYYCRIIFKNINWSRRKLNVPWKSQIAFQNQPKIRNYVSFSCVEKFGWLSTFGPQPINLTFRSYFRKMKCHGNVSDRPFSQVSHSKKRNMLVHLTSAILLQNMTWIMDIPRWLRPWRSCLFTFSNSFINSSFFPTNLIIRLFSCCAATLLCVACKSGVCIL